MAKEEYNKRYWKNCKNHGQPEPVCDLQISKYNWPETPQCKEPPRPTEEEEKEFKKKCLECCHFDPIEE